MSEHVAYLLLEYPASTWVMEKAGLQYEGPLRQDILHWGTFEDIDQYGLLRSDFLAHEHPRMAYEEKRSTRSL